MYQNQLLGGSINLSMSHNNSVIIGMKTMSKSKLEDFLFGDVGVINDLNYILCLVYPLVLHEIPPCVTNPWHFHGTLGITLIFFQNPNQKGMLHLYGYNL
jgi:hypothetical protein